MLDAGNYAARFVGLPEGVRPGHVLAAFKAAAPHAGIAPRLVHVMDWFFAWTQAIDWEADSRPIVWPSASKQAEALGLTLSQVKRLNRRLIETGLIVPVDGPGGCRKGERHKRTGKILWAYGFDLSPLAVRMPEFQEIALRGAERRKAYDTYRRRYTIARKSIHMILTTAAEHGASGDWHPYANALKAAPVSWPTAHTDAIHDLAAATQHLEQLVKDAKGALEAGLISVEKHREQRINAPLYITNYKPSEDPFQDTVVAHEKSSRGVTRTMTPDQDRAAGKKSNEAPRQDRGSVIKITPDELMDLAPRLRPYLSTSSPLWPDLVEAADWLRHDLQVSKTLWGDACITIGRERAAIALAIVSTKPANHFKSGPAGYFSGMIRKAKEGELHLDRTIWAMRRQKTSTAMRQ